MKCGKVVFNKTTKKWEKVCTGPYSRIAYLDEAEQNSAEEDVDNRLVCQKRCKYHKRHHKWYLKCRTYCSYKYLEVEKLSDDEFFSKVSDEITETEKEASEKE